jgi:hypothetical protein
VDVDDIITAVILAAAVGVAIRRLPWKKLKTLGARSWPTTQGKIEFGTVIEHRTRYFSYYVAQMAYSYAVNGEYFSGYYEKMFFRESSADKFAADLKGRPAFIRHKASSPDVSTLLKEDQQSLWPSPR